MPAWSREESHTVIISKWFVKWFRLPTSHAILGTSWVQTQSLSIGWCGYAEFMKCWKNRKSCIVKTGSVDPGFAGMAISGTGFRITIPTWLICISGHSH